MADLPVAPATPAVSVQIGFDVSGTPQNIGSDYAAIVWTDVTADVRPDPALTFNRGRPEAGQPAAAGQLTVTLLNSDGDYTPGDNGGTYGAIHTRMPIRVVADAGGYSSGDYAAEYAHSTSLWVGFITDIDYTLDGGQALVTITASDIIAAAARTTCGPWLNSRLTKIAASNLLAYWPLTDGAPNGLGNSSTNSVPVLPDETLLSGVSGGLPLTRGGALSDGVVACNVATGGLSPDNQANVSFTPPTTGQPAYLQATIPVSSPANLSVAAWIRRPAVTSSTSFSCALDILGSSYERLQIKPVETVGGAQAIQVTHSSYSLNVVGNFSVPVDEWHHVYVRTTATDIYVYVDGVQVGTQAFFAAPAYGSSLIVRLGASLTIATPTGGYSGQLAHVAVWTGHDAAWPAALADRGASQPTAADRFTDLVYVTPNPTGLATWLDADGAAENPISAQATSGNTFLTVAQQVADAERGSIVATKDGKLALLAQRGTAAAADPVLTLSAETDVLAIDGLFGVDDADNINAATVTLQPSGRAFTATRATDPGIESTSLDLWTTSEAFAQTLASALANADTQTPRAPSLTLSMDWLAHADLAVAAVQLDLGDTITVTDLPASAPASSLTVQVRSITHTIAKDSWTVQVDTDPPTNLGVLDDTDLGKLDDTMILGV